MNVEEILATLIAFPSVVGTPNGEIVDWIRDYCQAAGAEVTVLPGPEGDRSNLFVTVGPRAGSGLHHLRTYGRRAGRRAGMELGSVRPASRGRQALRPRHHRHEGLSRLRIGRAPRTCGNEPAAASPSRILLRRRGGVPWRAASLGCVADAYARGRLARLSASRAGCSLCARTRGRPPRGSR